MSNATLRVLLGILIAANVLVLWGNIKVALGLHLLKVEINAREKALALRERLSILTPSRPEGLH